MEGKGGKEVDIGWIGRWVLRSVLTSQSRLEGFAYLERDRKSLINFKKIVACDYKKYVNRALGNLLKGKERLF